MNALHTETLGNYIIKIFTDDDAMNPRSDFDNAGKMVCFHKRYKLGDKTELSADDFENWDELAKHLTDNEGAKVIFPLWLYDHSGITISAKPFSCSWDSGRVGFIYMDDKGLEEFGGDIETAKRCLLSEVEVYDDYLRGNVYGYTVTDLQGNEIDSCWGYFGDYDSEYGVLSEAKAVARYHEAKNASGERFAEKFMCC